MLDVRRCLAQTSAEDCLERTSAFMASISLKHIGTIWIGVMSLVYVYLLILERLWLFHLDSKRSP